MQHLWSFVGGIAALAVCVLQLWVFVTYFIREQHWQPEVYPSMYMFWESVLFVLPAAFGTLGYWLLFQV